MNGVLFRGLKSAKLPESDFAKLGSLRPLLALLNAAVSRAGVGPAEPLTFGTAFAGSEAKLGLGVLARVKTKQVGELK